MKDVLYDYSTFNPERVKEIFTSWDNMGGYHGLLIKRCAGLAMKKTFLDVGCGLCHLYEALKAHPRKSVERYVGVDTHPQILSMARKRYPDLEILEMSVFDLSALPSFDTVFAVGLYREMPKHKTGIREMFQHADRCVVLTYFAEKRFQVPDALRVDGGSIEFIEHDIDERLEIVRLWKI